MKKFTLEWNKKTILQKSAFVIKYACFVIAIVLSGLQCFGKWEDNWHILGLLFGVYMITEAILLWKDHRCLAIMSLLIAILIIFARVIVLLIEFLSI